MFALNTVFVITVTVFCSIFSASGFNFTLSDHELIQYFDHINSLDFEYEITDVPKELFDYSKETLHWNLSVFGQNLNLKLIKNNRFRGKSDSFVPIDSIKDATSNDLKINTNNCHYIHVDSSSSIALSNCFDKKIVSI